MPSSSNQAMGSGSLKSRFGGEPGGRLDLIQSFANLRHDVKHLAGYFTAALVVGGRFRRGIIAKPGVSVMDGIPRGSPCNNRATFVGHATGHQSNEILSRIIVRVVKLRVSADDRAVGCISDQINR